MSKDLMELGATMDFKQVLIVVFLVVLAQVIPAFMILSLKSDIEILKKQISTLQEFIDSQQEFIDVQKEWNLTSISHDTVFDKRLDMLEQKMRKVYQGYDVKPSRFYDVNSLYLHPRLGDRDINGLLPHPDSQMILH